MAKRTNANLLHTLACPRYNDAGIRLGVALFGETDKPLSNDNDPWTLAKKIAKFVKKYNLQGVDVDFEEYDKFEQRQATKWVIPLTRALRDALPAGQYYISHAPIAPLFNTDQYPLGYTWVEQRVGSLIDYYNVQFYNQGDYKDCGSLVNKAVGSWPNTALLQLHTVYKIPLSKIVVGKVRCVFHSVYKVLLSCPFTHLSRSPL